MNFMKVRVPAQLYSAVKNIVRKRSTITVLEEAPKITTVDEGEISRHGDLASNWWNENGEMKALHAMNKLRVPFVRDCLISNGVTQMDFLNTPTPLAGLKVLDVGCGGGILSEPLACIGAKVTGLDAGDKLIEVAKKHANDNPSLAENLNYICGKIEDHAASHKEVYDAVVASEVIEHVPEKELFLESCSEVLKPGGSIFITTINRTVCSWVLGVIAAEHLLHLVPSDTHDWEKFSSPSEIQYNLERHGCYTKLIHGMRYHISCNEWTWTADTSINYALHAVKKK